MLIRLLCILTVLPTLLLAQDQITPITCTIEKEPDNALSEHTPTNTLCIGAVKIESKFHFDDGRIEGFDTIHTAPPISRRLNHAIAHKRLMPKQVIALLTTALTLGITPIITECADHIASNSSSYCCISPEDESESSFAQTVPRQANIFHLPHEIKADIAHRYWQKKNYQLDASDTTSKHEGGSESISPDGHTLTVGFIDGTTQSWRIPGTRDSFLRNSEHELNSILARDFKPIPSYKSKLDANVDTSAKQTTCTIGDVEMVSAVDVGDLRNEPFVNAKLVSRLNEAIYKKLTPEQVISLLTTSITLGIAPIVNACVQHIASNLSYYYCASEESESSSSSAQTITPTTDTHLSQKIKALIAQQCKKSQSCHGMDHQSPVRSVSFFPRSDILASSANDNAIKLWNPRTGALLKTLTLDKNTIGATTFASGSGIIAILCTNGTIILADPNTGDHLNTFTDSQDMPNSICFSPDGKILACGLLSGGIKLLDPNTGATLTIPAPQADYFCSNVLFSPNGKILLYRSSYDTFTLQNTDNYDLSTAPIQQKSLQNAFAFSPDSKILACGLLTGNINLFDPNTGNISTTLKGHRDGVCSCTFSPNGDILASGSEDWTVKLWNPHTGDLLTTLTSCLQGIHSVSFSCDGTMLAAGSQSGIIAIWRDPATFESFLDKKEHLETPMQPKRKRDADKDSPVSKRARNTEI